MVPSKQMEAPTKALCLLSDGTRFEASVLRVGTTSVFLKSDREDLRFSEGLQVTLVGRHGPVLTFHGQVATWVRRCGARIECDADTDDVVLVQLGEWSSDEDGPLTAEIPRTGEVAPLEAPGRPSTPLPEQAPRTTKPPSPPPVESAPARAGPDAESSSSLRPRTASKPRLDARVLGHPAASTALAGTRVLVIDDDPGIVRLLERSLKKFGCTVIGTDDPPTGLQLAADQEADVVVMDWVLPAIPGARMLEQLRRVRADTPIAVISGALWWDEAERQIRDMGATTVLEKPIDFEKLIDFLRGVRTNAPAYR